MDTATMNTRKIAIEGMTGDVCVQKVTTALKGLQGVTTQSVKVGEATIKADQAGCDAACAAIDRAGYEASADDQAGDENNTASDTDTSRDNQKVPSMKMGSHQPRTPATTGARDGARDGAGNINTNDRNHGTKNPSETSPTKTAGSKH